MNKGYSASDTRDSWAAGVGVKGTAKSREWFQEGALSRVQTVGVQLWLAAILAAVSVGSADAATLPEARNGAIVWLERNQNADGSWGAGQRQPVVTAEALLALAKANRSNGPAARKAIGWLQAQELVGNDHQIRRVRALHAAGLDVSDGATAVEAIAVSADGWGTVGSEAPTSYDTALGLGILQNVGVTVTTASDKRTLVLGALRTDGGWAGDGTPASVGASDATLTAEMVRALVGDPADLTQPQAYIDGAGGGAPVLGAGVLELAARLAAIHAHDGTDTVVENALLALAASSGAIFGSDPFANAIGLLAVTTKPGVVFDSGPGVDDDGDGVNNEDDLFPQDDEVSADSDGDGVGDNNDPDADGDGVLDVNEPAGFAGDPTEHTDTDADGIGNNADTDDDGDGVLDLDELEIGTDPLDTDTDNDLDPDGSDPCPLVALATDNDLDGVCSDVDCADGDPLAAFDTDSDMICDAHDPDDDEDGVPDLDELAFGTDPLNPQSMPPALVPTEDWDRDGLDNGIEQVNQTSPYRADTDNDGALDQMETDLLGVAAALDPFTQPPRVVAVFSSITPALESHQTASPTLVATGSGGQPTPIARTDHNGDLSTGGGLVNHAGFLPQVTLAADLDGDGLVGFAEVDQGTSHVLVDTDGDRYVDGNDGAVSLSQYLNGRDLDGGGFADGELGAGTDPTDSDDHVGEPGDVAPWGTPDGRVDASDAALGFQIAADPSMTNSLTIGDQKVVTDQAADANKDGMIDAGDAVLIMQKAITEAP